MTFEPWPDQRTPALAIVARGDQIEPKGPTEYVVRSQSHPEIRHRVVNRRDAWSCSCPFFYETKRTCIHIFAVRYKAGFEKQLNPGVERPVCDRCRSSRVVINGCRRNQSGIVQRFLCRGCGHRFSGMNGFRKRRANPDRIALALDLYFRGLSFRKVSDHLAQVYDLHVSAMTVYRWVTHYSKLAAGWMDAQGAKVGDVWHVDETVVNVNGDHRFLWNVMDSETRFLMATHVSRNRSLANTRAPFKKAKQVTATIPTEIRSDGMTTYPAAIRKEFGRKHQPSDPPSTLKHGGDRATYSPHRVVPSIRAPESNNLIERLHGTEKERFKVMRAFDNDRGTSALAEGFRVHYNLVRNHMSLGTTPGVAAGLAEVTGFRWREMILRAAQEGARGEPTTN